MLSYLQGFFGKGILSKSQPQFEKCGDLLLDLTVRQKRTGKTLILMNFTMD